MITQTNFIVYVKDQVKSTDFYSNLLNINPSLNVPGMTEFKLGDKCILGLMPEQGIKKLLTDSISDPESTNGISRCELYLTVDNPELYLENAVKLEAKIISPLAERNWGDVAGYTIDPDGHVIAFAKSINTLPADIVKIKKNDHEGNFKLLISIAETHSNSNEHLENIKARLCRELEEIEDNRDIFIKRQENQPIAIIQIIYKNADNDPDLADGEKIAHIHDLEVHKSFQKQGVGRYMMEFAEKYAKQKGIEKLTLGVDSTNSRAVKLYNGIGYKVFKKEEGRTPDEELLLMSKSL